MTSLAALTALAGCSGSAATPVTTAPTAAPPAITATPPAPAAAAGPLGAVDWANRTYEFTMFEGEGEMTYRVVGGETPTELAPSDPAFEWLAVEPPVYGDLDGDGVAEAAIVVVYNNGSERFNDKLLVYTAGPGGPRQLGVVYGGNRGDSGLGPITIRAGALVVTRFRGEPEDDPCQPSQQWIETWRWDGEFLSEDEAARRAEPRPMHAPRPRCAR